MPNAVIAHDPEGEFDRAALLAKAKAWPGIDGMDLVPSVTVSQRYDWDGTSWTLGEGYGRRAQNAVSGRRHRLRGQAQYSAAAGRSGLRR